MVFGMLLKWQTTYNRDKGIELEKRQLYKKLAFFRILRAGCARLAICDFYIEASSKAYYPYRGNR